LSKNVRLINIKDSADKPQPLIINQK